MNLILLLSGTLQEDIYDQGDNQQDGDLYFGTHHY